MTSVPRLAIEVEGWLELGLPDRAISRVGSLVANPTTRTLGLELSVEALIAMSRFSEALTILEELLRLGHNPEWVDLREGWCRKRNADLPGAIACMERLIERTPRSGIGHYNLACYLSLHGDSERALHELSLACGLDPKFRTLAKTESDYANLQIDDRFRELLAP